MTNESMAMGPADIAAVTGGNRNGGMFGDDNGAWWLIVLFLFAFAGGWNGGGFGSGGGGASNNYVLASDFATIQRQLSDGFSGQERRTDAIVNGLCDGFYTQAQLINGVNMNIAQNGYESRLATQTLGAQMAQCCCDVREGIAGVNYNMATQANGITNAVNTGFCQTNYNNANNTRDILENQNANARAILDALNANKVEALKERIAEQNQQISALNLAASQAAQNNYLVDTLTAKLATPCPIPAYLTCNPNAPLNYSVNYGYGCGCGSGCS